MSEDTMQVVRFVCATGVWGILASLVFMRLFPQATESLAKQRLDRLQRTLEAERDAAEETVRLRAEATRLLLERWRKEADIDEVRRKIAAIEAMGYEWRWTKSRPPSQ